MNREGENMKKLLCILLSFCVLLPGLCLGAHAAQPAVKAEGEIENAYPLIVVRGMDFTDGLVRGLGGPDEKTVNPLNNLSAGKVFKTLFRAAGALVTRGEKGAVDEIIRFAASLFDGYACNADGESLDPDVTSVSYPQSMAQYPEVWEDAGGHEAGLVRSAAERYGAEDVYYFIYDWRLDAGYNAANLAALIDTALRDHGCDKADLVCCSMGGIVTLTYLADFGSEKIDSLVSDSGTMFGTDVTTDLFRGKVLFEADAVYRFIAQKLPKLKTLAALLYKTGTLGRVCSLINRFAAKYEKEIYEGVLTPVFGSMPAMWELVRGEYYEEAKEYIFGGSQAYAGMLAKTDRVQREVVAKKQEILENAMASGMKFGIVAGYNTPNAPAYESAALQGDGTLETRTMSFGALVSEVGGTLSEEELAVGDPAYVSADRCINASTAMFPEITWFVKDSQHVACRLHSDYTYLIFSILEAETQPDIHTWEKYPQFTQADEEENLTPLTAAPGKWDGGISVGY
jgi:hypothetical protein